MHPGPRPGGRGARPRWQPKPVDAPPAAGASDGAEGMPDSAGQAPGPRRQTPSNRSRQRQQQQQQGTDAAPGTSTLHPDALTWQQQDLMQQRQPQERPQPEQRRRQRQPRPGSQQSQRHSDAEPSQAGDQQQQQAGEYGQQQGGTAIAGDALQQQLEQGAAPASSGPPRQQRRRQQREQPPQPQQRQRQGQGRQMPDGGYGPGHLYATAELPLRHWAGEAGGYGYPPPHWQHEQQVQQYYGGGWEPHGPGSYGYPPGISMAGPEPQPGRRQRQQRPPPPPARQQRRREQQPDRPPPLPQPSQPLEGVHQHPAASSGGEEGASEAEQAQQQQQQQQQDGGMAESPHCLVCCSPMTEVAVGACNHKEVCGMCTLRLRICYGRKDCPLCKTELQEVVIAPWRGDGPPDFDWYMARPEYLARSAKWDKATVGVLADRWQRGGRLSSRLMHELQRRTALACVLCDRAAQRPFARPEQLLRHVQEEHDHRLCNLCLQEGHLFALEMQPFPGFEALQQHLEDAHPRCDFCRRRFYDTDGLWKHMQQAHYSCHVCPPPTGVFAYFNTSRDLVQHMRNEHHMCEEPECADCFVAFPTAEELRRHHLERHSARMPRWDPSRARPLQIDIQYVGAPSAAVRQAGPARGEGRRGSGGGRGGRGRPQDVRMLDSAGSGRPGSAAATAAAASARPEYALEGDGGFLIVDDDLGMLPSDNAFPLAAGGHGAAHWEPAAGGSWAARRPPPPPRSGGEEFPSLAVAAAAAAVGAGAEREGAGPAAGRRPPPLVKKTVRCPCGRRASHFVVEEGQEVPTLACDAVCELEGRRSQLAGAFGVEHPEHHVSYFDRHRVPVFSGQLLAAAQKHPKAVEGLEKAFAAFLADGSAKRHSLPAMPREQRAMAHELAEQYGLASSSYGQEPHRFVELFKTDSSGVPTKLLSRVAPTIPPDEVAAMVREGSGHPIRLTDVALSVDLHYYLRRWEGAYKLEWEQGDAVVVRCERREDMEDALNQLGGGIRGLFRIDRTYRPKSAITAAGPGAVGSRGGAAGWGASSGTASAGPSDSWTVVAASAPRPQQAPTALPPQQQQEEDAGPSGNASALPSGWTVIGSKKAPRVAKPAAAAGGGGGSSSRGAGIFRMGLADDAWEA